MAFGEDDVNNNNASSSGSNFFIEADLADYASEESDEDLDGGVEAGDGDDNAVAASNQENVPDNIRFPCHVFSMDFHPSHDIIAAGLINGQVQVWKYSLEKNELVYQFKQHKESCRAVGFSVDGNTFFSCSADRSVKAIDCNTGSIIWNQPKAHEDAVNALLVCTENLLATGDDSGYINIWDTRYHKAIVKFEEHADFISDMTFNDDKYMLYVTSGDGCLSSYNLKQRKPKDISTTVDDEFLSVCEVKNGKRVVCGSSEGTLHIFNTRDFGEPADRFMGHPASVDSMLFIDEDTVATGSGDGMIRVVQIQQNKLLGIIGEHDDYSIEQIRLSRDLKFLASSAHDNTVRFWDVGYLFEDQEEDGDGDGDADMMDDGDEDDSDDNSDAYHVKGKGKKVLKNNTNMNKFFADL
eukprot:GEZU01000046.1.p1 GENE.GEZU01000046.1~~GEZU01000046.1.p1  ORF type:complete len:417 (+),score=141.27 GEZU01000046.1:23-1252(+)